MSKVFEAKPYSFRKNRPMKFYYEEELQL